MSYYLKSYYYYHTLCFLILEVALAWGIFKDWHLEREEIDALYPKQALLYDALYPKQALLAVLTVERAAGLGDEHRSNRESSIPSSRLSCLQNTWHYTPGALGSVTGIRWGGRRVRQLFQVAPSGVAVAVERCGATWVYIMEREYRSKGKR